MDKMERTNRPSGRRRGGRRRRARRRRELFWSWLTILVLLAVTAGVVFAGTRFFKAWENEKQPPAPLESSREILPETFPQSPASGTEPAAQPEASGEVSLREGALRVEICLDQ